MIDELIHHYYYFCFAYGISPAPAEEDDVVLKREDPKNNKNKNNKNNKNKPKNPAEAVVDQWSEAYYGSEDKQNLEDGNSKQEPVAAADAQANNGALTVANQEEDAEVYFSN